MYHQMDLSLVCIYGFHFWSDHSVHSLRTRRLGKRAGEGRSAIIANGLPADGWQLILHVPGGDTGPPGATAKCMLSHPCLVQLGKNAIYLCHLAWWDLLAVQTHLAATSASHFLFTLITPYLPLPLSLSHFSLLRASLEHRVEMEQQFLSPRGNKGRGLIYIIDRVLMILLCWALFLF